MKKQQRLGVFCAAGAIGLAALIPSAHAQTNAANNAVNQAGNTAGNVVGQVGNTAGNVVGQTGQTVGQLGNTVGQVGNAAGNVVGGLQPTLQPVGQGVGNALNNLTQPDTVASLLEFLAGVIPNHIEAHVNLDALRVEKVTLDIRGVDLRNLRVDLLVANSRNAGQVRPAMNYGGASGTAGNASGATSSSTPLPGDTPIAGSSTRNR